MITILSKPQTYTTTNLAAFKITSDRDGILQFKVDVIDADTNTIMTTQKYATLPMIDNGTMFNIAPLLSSFLDYDIDISNTILVPINRNLKRYHINITELYRNNNGYIVPGDVLYIPEDFYIWLSNLGDVEFSIFDYTDYILSPGATSRFLNNKPTIVNTLQNEAQYLYFISTVTANLQIDIYQNPAVKIGSHTIAGVNPNKTYRANVSPAALTSTYGNDIVNLLGSQFTDEFNLPFGSPAHIDYYTVRLVDTSGNDLTEVRTFHNTAIDCRTKTINMVFENNLGGFDSLVLTNPKEQFKSAKGSIAANAYQFDINGNYTNINNGVFNPVKVNISATSTQTYTAISQPLNDGMSVFVKTIVEAKKVYVVLPSGMYYPVNITDFQYNVGQKRLSTSNIRASIAFSVVDSKIIL